MSFVTRSITRSWVLAVLGALALFALLVILGDSTASATLSDGDVVLGAAPVNACTAGANVNCTSSLTGIVNTTSGGDAFHGFSASGIGVGGFSTSGTGVKGETDVQSGGYGVYGNNTGSGDGVFGQGHVGVHGQGVDGVYGEGSIGGVVGVTNDGAGVNGLGLTSGNGVEGDGAGAGVVGKTLSATGTGVSATNGGFAGATALKATGKTSFSRSGKLTVPAGTSSATKSAISLSSTSVVLATIQGNQAGVYVQGVTHTTTSFTIHLSKNTTADLPVGWFVVN
jgi:hypothetical protein